jgi:hypothetical protein
MARRPCSIFGKLCGAILLALWLKPGLAQTAATVPHAAQAVPHHTPGLHHVRARRHHHRAVIKPPPAPPAPVARVQTTAAPLPNEEAQPPQEQLQPGVNVVPGNLQLHFPPSGDGYPPASSEQTLDDTRAPKVPGVTLTLPLGQPGQGPPP